MKVTFILVRKHVLTNQNLNMKLFHFEDFVKKWHILCLCFVTFVVLI
jgi:hypothetical protein